MCLIMSLNISRVENGFHERWCDFITLIYGKKLLVPH